MGIERKCIRCGIKNHRERGFYDGSYGKGKRKQCTTCAAKLGYLRRIKRALKMAEEANLKATAAMIAAMEHTEKAHKMFLKLKDIK